MDLVPGRSGTAHENWLEERGEQFRSSIQITTMDPLQGQQERHRLACSQDATSVLDAFHIVKLAGDAPGEVRRRVLQDMTDHRGCAYQCESRRSAHWASARCLPRRHTAQCRRLAAHLIERLPTCPIPKIARLGVNPTQVEGRTRHPLRHRRSQQRTAPKPSMDIIELGRRAARGYPNPTNYQPRMLLITAGLDASLHTQL